LKANKLQQGIEQVGKEEKIYLGKEHKILIAVAQHLLKLHYQKSNVI
jgi:hypothetical protein